MNQKSSFLVVGQGIAGTIVTFKLLQQGHEVMVVDNHHHQSSSKVAAGLFNPLVFKWITKSWNAKAHLDSAISTYRQMEAYLKSGYVFDDPLVRIIASAQELNQWQRRESQEDYKDWIISNDERLSETWDKGFGNRGVIGSGWVDLSKMLNDFRSFLKNQNRLIEEEMNYNDLHLASSVIYKSAEYDYVICCEGAAAVNNPYFKTAPFKSAKGEVLVVETDQLKLNKLLNYGQFIIPLGSNQYKIGTNFDWMDLSYRTTEKIKKQAIESFENFFKITPKVIDHQAGIRPSTADRKPLIGRSKEDARICIFNGLGSKGVLLAPLTAEHLINHLLLQIPIHSEIDVNRVILDPMS